MRMANPEVVHPTAQDRVDLLDHLPHRLAFVSTEDLPELGKQRCPLFELRRILRSSLPVTAENAAILKPQERKTSVFPHIHRPTLLFVDLHSEFRHLLPRSPVHRPHQPAAALGCFESSPARRPRRTCLHLLHSTRFPRFLTQADRFIFGVAPSDYGPGLLLMPFGFYLAMDILPSGVLPIALRPARHYPRFWIWDPSSGLQRDFNPPEQRAAQHTL